MHCSRSSLPKLRLMYERREGVHYSSMSYNHVDWLPLSNFIRKPHVFKSSFGFIAKGDAIEVLMSFAPNNIV